MLTLKQKKTPGRLIKKFLLLVVLIIAVLGGVLALKASSLSSKIFVGQKTTFLEKVRDLIRGGGDNAKLIGEDLGQINILLLGVGGEGHDGPYLTDTMILAQIRPDIGEITLTSVPRDYLAVLPDGSQDKINAAFAYGLGKNMDWDQAGLWSREAVQSISGLKIPYFAVIDFSGFEKAVDQIGGLDVHVDRGFTDYQYPDSGTGYLPPITFTEGEEHMNGERALEFARSRHAAGPEGSDFARSLRQQKIIEAFKQKALSLNIVKDAGTLNNLLNIFADHFHTNISPAQLYRIYSLTANKNPQVLSLSLDPDTGLICPEILASSGAYVLVPCDSAQDVENFFKNSFSIGKLKNENGVVWLATSTGDQQAYQTAMRKLTDAGIKVFQLAYSKDDLPQTTVYQVNPKPATAEFIQNELHGTAVNLPPPGVHVSADKVDIIVVLGQNAPVEAPPTPYVRPPAQTATTATATLETASTTPTASSTK